jgi:hypothetical protein
MRRGGIFLLASTIALSSCTPEMEETAYFRRVNGPDGTRNWFAVECREMTDCYVMAGKACPAGYALADGTTNSSTESSVSARRAFGGVYANGESRTKTGGTLLIHCTYRAASQ